MSIYDNPKDSERLVKRASLLGAIAGAIIKLLDWLGIIDINMH